MKKMVSFSPSFPLSILDGVTDEETEAPTS